ncbi:glycosyltransferase family 4 protein [Pseudomonas sp. NPDC087598]|uniref:glycosyltransferase family 4 protein n=1 Tax=Pseudomonas sp. NPDC087598 TaxID=3364440 RepID=UPI00381C1E8C
MSVLKKSVLIVCNDVVGSKMAGPAIRCVELAKALSESLHVKLCAPEIDFNVDLPFERYVFADPKFQRDAQTVDIVIFQGDALRANPFLKKIPGILVADLYCPVPLEYHQASSKDDIAIRGYTSNFLSEVLHEQLVFADHFLCASEKQRDFWLGALTVAGRINAHRWPIASHANLSDLISLLPFGLAIERPVATRPAIREAFNIPDDDVVLVWGGGLYQWFDPLTPIRAIHQLALKGTRVHLVFIGVKHPNPGIAQPDMCTQAVELATRLGVNGDLVHFNFGWVDYSDRHNFLLDADAGISAHYNNPETRFSFRTRMLDYIWCGLPIIATKGDVFGDSLLAEGMGIAVDYEDVEGWVSAIEVISRDRMVRQAYSAQVIRNSASYRWDILVEPLIERFHKMTVSPDRVLVRKRYASKGSPLSFWLRLRRLYASGGIRSVFAVFIRKISKRLR